MIQAKTLFDRLSAAGVPCGAPQICESTARGNAVFFVVVRALVPAASRLFGTLGRVAITLKRTVLMLE